MDPLSMLAVRFHVKGEFLNVGRVVHWIGGSEVMSYIDRDKVSYPEIVGHLRDHMEVPEGTMLHWLFPGMELSDGLTVLWDDNSCLKMSDAICDGGVADIYVECRHGQGEDDADNEHSDFEDEMEHKSVSESEEDVSVRKESREEAERQVARLREFYSSPTKKGKQVSACDSAVVTEASQGVMKQANLSLPKQAKLEQQQQEQKQMVAKSSASASTRRRGSATLQVTASIPGSQATSTVTIRNSGKASTQVTTSAPPIKKIAPKDNQVAKKPRPGGMLLLPPWDSAKL
ncbi:hypothetical protein EJB05_47021, partial [Eragrostis curvula]